MSLEQDINQKTPFQSEYHRALVNIIFTHGWINERFSAQMKLYELTLQQYNVLRILRGAKTPISTCIIRERMLDKMPDTSRIVDRLVQKGLASKSLCPTDKRLIDVEITHNGLDLLDKINLDNNPVHTSIEENLSAEEAKQLSLLLDKLRGSL